jgi:hypothetical protein
MLDKDVIFDQLEQLKEIYFAEWDEIQTNAQRLGQKTNELVKDVRGAGEVWKLDMASFIVELEVQEKNLVAFQRRLEPRFRDASNLISSNFDDLRKRIDAEGDEFEKFYVRFLDSVEKMLETSYLLVQALRDWRLACVLLLDRVLDEESHHGRSRSGRRIDAHRRYT